MTATPGPGDNSQRLGDPRRDGLSLTAVYPSKTGVQRSPPTPFLISTLLGVCERVSVCVSVSVCVCARAYA